MWWPSYSGSGAVVADRNAARLQALRNHAAQADMQQTILQICVLDHEVVGKHETTLERAAGNAAVKKLTLLHVSGRLAGDHQSVLLHGQVDVIGPEAGNRHGQAIRLFAGLLDVVGGIGWDVGCRLCSACEPGEPVEANGGAEQRRKIVAGHVKTSCESKV
jgi:hypothetical protein